MKFINCKICNKIFKPLHPANTICSKKCYKKSRIETQYKYLKKIKEMQK